MSWFSEIDNTWTLFLDRDGVINVRPLNDYVRKWEDFAFLPGVLEAMTTFSALFNRIIVVTNQQGIGKKIMSEGNLLEIHRYMCGEIEGKGGRIDACFFAPELKSDPNHSRKPSPKMALKAKGLFPEIDFQRSIMIGDTDTDIEFGKNLGMKTVRIVTDVETIAIEADYNVSSLLEIAQLWKK